MAAYASLLSLGHILEQISQHPPSCMDVLDKAQIDSLLENITFLQEFLEDFSLVRGEEIQELEEKIARSAYEAEDIIKSYVVDQIHENFESKSRRRRSRFSCLGFVYLFLKKMTLSDELRNRFYERWSSTLYNQDLQNVIEEIGSVKIDVMKIKETEGVKIMEQPRKAATAGSFIPGASDSKNTMVGFDEDLNQIIETLTGDETKFQILSIVGMGGIGKTTLAKNVFDDPSIVQHFDLQAWVTISQQYSAHKILVGILKEIGGGEITQQRVDELGLRLHKSLSGRRYFIVMDDMWSIEVWDGIKRFFPDNNNGSRAMITTRLTKVADGFRSCTPHQLQFLGNDQSWALFCDRVFGKERCPLELEEVGKEIVRNCRRLPLAIVAISGLVAKSSRTVKYWEYVANNTNAALNTGVDGCLEILSLSYNHLPVHLKPCFLYMARFPEDHKIRISRLVKQWVAEGILKPIRSRNLEEVAEDNLKDLIERNLIQVHDYGSRDKIKTCTIHDLVRELCLMEAQKEKFRYLNNHSRVIDDDIRFVSQQSYETVQLNSTLEKLPSLRYALRIRRFCSSHEEIVVEIVRLVNSRYIVSELLSFSNLLKIFESISLLWNLQTIIISTPKNLPAEIWEMPQLRHLKSEKGCFYLPDPPSTNCINGRRDIIVLKNLQTLYNIRNFRCTDEVVHRIPNLKKLGITYSHYHLICSLYGWDYYEVDNLARLHNLESLQLSIDENVVQNLNFPSSLKKLTLKRCEVPWEDLTVVGSLPHLEVLNLINNAASGREWNPVEGEFLELKSLRIEGTNLEEWIADSSHFPSLEKLELVGLFDLKEIPDGIGEIPTLGSISLEYCSDSANSSANNLHEEQQQLGNYDLQVRVEVSTDPRFWYAMKRHWHDIE